MYKNKHFIIISLHKKLFEKECKEKNDIDSFYK